jgi:hypothetical protein
MFVTMELLYGKKRERKREQRALVLLYNVKYEDRGYKDVY